jgi:hypothetical protein
MATYIKPSDPRYKKLTPAQRNANTLLNLKNSVKPAPAKPMAKKPTTTSKGKTSIDKDGNKVVIDSNGKTVTSKDKSSITYYNKRGKTTIKSDSDGFTTKSVVNKKGRSLSYIDDGSKSLYNKKGKMNIGPWGSSLTNKSGRSIKREDGSSSYISFKKDIRYDKDSPGKITARNATTYEPIKPTPTKKPTAPAAKPTPTKAPAKTVSQVWKEKTGKDWSEAKKLGLSDGSASSNMALLKKLNSGKITDAVLKPKEETKPATVPTREEAIEAGESLVRMRRGGVKGKPVLKKKIVKKPVMRRGGIKKK